MWLKMQVSEMSFAISPPLQDHFDKNLLHTAVCNLDRHFPREKEWRKY